MATTRSAQIWFAVLFLPIAFACGSNKDGDANQAESDYTSCDAGPCADANAPLGMQAVTEAGFNDLLEELGAIYRPLAALHGARLEMNGAWTEERLVALAADYDSKWVVVISGSAARLPGMTRDSFSIAVCHELGHLFGGYPWVHIRANAEGEADYFTTHTCTRSLWGKRHEENARYRSLAPAPLKETCKLAWQTQVDQDLCYRAGLSAHTLFSAMAVLDQKPVPRFDEHDPAEVPTTWLAGYGSFQCRLDTMVQAAACKIPFDPKTIPGKTQNELNGVEAEAEAAKVSCFASKTGTKLGARPRCWFKEVTPSP